MSAAVRDLIRQSMPLGIEYVCRKTGFGTESVLVTASYDSEELIKAETDLGYPRFSAVQDFGPGSKICATSPFGGIVINLSVDTCWSQEFELRMKKTLAHEYFHQVQRALAKIFNPSETVDADLVPVKGPAWLIEGAAELIAWMIMDDAGLRALPVAEAPYSVALLRSTAFPLSAQQARWSPPVTIADPYKYVFAATDYLTASSPAKLNLLMAYWDRIGKGILWGQAFESTFGKSIQNFYADVNPVIPPAPDALSLRYVGAAAPVSNATLGGGPGISVPYYFQVQGFEFASYSTQISNIVKTPMNAGFAIAGSYLIVYMSSEAPSGTYTVRLDLPDGRSVSASFSHSQQQSATTFVAPSIDGVTPSALYRGATGATLVVAGKNFVFARTSATVNGVPVDLSVTGPGQAELTIPGSLLLGEGLRISLTNPPPGGGSSKEFVVALTDPKLLSVDPGLTTLPGAGASARIRISTSSPSVFWSAFSNSSWLHFSFTTTGTGSAEIVYAVQGNSSSVPRTATVNIAGQTFSYLQGAGDPLAPEISSVVQGASFLRAPLAPDTWFSVLGKNLGTRESAPNYSTITLGGAQVSLCGMPVPLSYNSGAGQLNALVPASIAPGATCDLIVTVDGRSSAAYPLELRAESPGLFLYSLGDVLLPVATHADYTLVGPSEAGLGPAATGETIVLWATGCRNSPPPPLRLGGEPVQVSYYGPSSGIPGLCQINIAIPTTLSPGGHGLNLIGLPSYTLWIK